MQSPIKSPLNTQPYAPKLTSSRAPQLKFTQTTPKSSTIQALQKYLHKKHLSHSLAQISTNSITSPQISCIQYCDYDEDSLYGMLNGLQGWKNRGSINKNIADINSMNISKILEGIQEDNWDQELDRSMREWGVQTEEECQQGNGGDCKYEQNQSDRNYGNKIKGNSQRVENLKLANIGDQKIESKICQKYEKGNIDIDDDQESHISDNLQSSQQQEQSTAVDRKTQYVDPEIENQKQVISSNSLQYSLSTQNSFQSYFTVKQSQKTNPNPNPSPSSNPFPNLTTHTYQSHSQTPKPELHQPILQTVNTRKINYQKKQSSSSQEWSQNDDIDSQVEHSNSLLNMTKIMDDSVYVKKFVNNIFQNYARKKEEDNEDFQWQKDQGIKQNEDENRQSGIYNFYAGFTKKQSIKLPESPKFPSFAATKQQSPFVTNSQIFQSFCPNQSNGKVITGLSQSNSSNSSSPAQTKKNCSSPIILRPRSKQKQKNNMIAQNVMPRTPPKFIGLKNTQKLTKTQSPKFSKSSKQSSQLTSLLNFLQTRLNSQKISQFTQTMKKYQKSKPQFHVKPRREILNFISSLSTQIKTLRSKIKSREIAYSTPEWKLCKKLSQYFDDKKCEQFKEMEVMYNSGYFKIEPRREMFQSVQKVIDLYGQFKRVQ